MWTVSIKPRSFLFLFPTIYNEAYFNLFGSNSPPLAAQMREVVAGRYPAACGGGGHWKREKKRKRVVDGSPFSSVSVCSWWVLFCFPTASFGESLLKRPLAILTRHR